MSGLLLGPDGAPIVQPMDPLTKATLAFFQMAGVGNVLYSKHQASPGVPHVHFCQVVWTNQIGGIIQWECAAGRTRPEAGHRMIKVLLLTGECAACKRPGEVSDDVETNWTERTFDPEDSFCIVSYDPETELYRRACDGATCGGN